MENKVQEAKTGDIYSQPPAPEKRERKPKSVNEKIKYFFSKHTWETLVALLTFVLVITSLINNFATIRDRMAGKKDTKPTEKVIIEKITQIPVKEIVNATPVPAKEGCKKTVGPIEIKSPSENERVTDNPVCFIIKRDTETYCSVTYSFRVNGGSFSTPSSNAPCISNMSKGAKKFELRIQSTVSSDQDQITRNFDYQGESDNSTTPVVTATPTPSSILP